MWTFALQILSAACSAVISALFRRWLNPKSSEANDALEAKTREAEALAAPARSKSDVVDRLRKYEVD